MVPSRDPARGRASPTLQSGHHTGSDLRLSAPHGSISQMTDIDLRRAASRTTDVGSRVDNKHSVTNADRFHDRTATSVVVKVVSPAPPSDADTRSSMPTRQSGSERMEFVLAGLDDTPRCLRNLVPGSLEIPQWF